MNWLRRFMAGRYGPDQLNLALLVLCFALYLLSSLFRIQALNLLALLCLILSYFRLLSRNIPKRRAENAKFLEAVRPIVRWYNVKKCRSQDKEHCYFKCPNCGQQLRVPKGKGKISITCRSCGVSFEKKT
ncbi:MAG: hypothetical protein K2F83_02720 [Oscillospiraceae bacterium]|nr:hypothetical protein [Oscillospiraceae bacterium]